MKRLFLILLSAVTSISAQESKEPTQAELASQDAAISLYPDLAKEGSKLYETVALKIESEKADHPEVFANPQWPLLLAVTQAVKIGITPIISKDKDSRDSIRQQIGWALRVTSDPKGITVEDLAKSKLILNSYGGNTPENRARLTALVLGASVADAEAITQTNELKTQTNELRYQSDRLQDLQRNQENKLFFNYPNK
jgi:hypothetical protein